MPPKKRKQPSTTTAAAAAAAAADSSTLADSKPSSSSSGKKQRSVPSKPSKATTSSTALPTATATATSSSSSSSTLSRCSWVTTDELYIRYHDESWGVVVNDDRLLFEFLVLEGAQAGLSWLTILKKRENYRAAFGNFDFEKIAQWPPGKIDELMNNEGIVRHRGKIGSVLCNAKCAVDVKKEFGSLKAFFWKFAPKTKANKNGWKVLAEIPAKTPESEEMAKEMSRRGFKFCGPTICYAFMQSVGIVNDHMRTCFKFK